MKTNKLLIIFLMCFCTMSCSIPYRVATRINSDGSIDREVYAFGDSAFIAGDLSHNPFLFSLDDNWKITKFDSVFKFDFFGKEEKLNVSASRHISSIEDFSKQLKPEKDIYTYALPKESFEKRFRWFYTYYTYKAVFSEIPDKGPVPIDNYLNKSEQRLWTQGDMTGYEGLNGVELYNLLEDIETRFWKWYVRSQYEISFDIIAHHLDKVENSIYSLQLPLIRDTLFISQEKNDNIDEFTPKEVCRLLDKYFQNDYFSLFYEEKETVLTNQFEDRCKVVNLFGLIFSYEITMPGKIIMANNSHRDGNMLIWKVDTYRFLTNDYVIEVESRVRNNWAFGMMIFLLLIAIGCFIWICRVRK